MNRFLSKAKLNPAFKLSQILPSVTGVATARNIETTHHRAAFPAASSHAPASQSFFSMMASSQNRSYTGALQSA